jgi:cytochrome c
MRILSCAFAALFTAAAPVGATQAENDDAMLKLATSSGCMACHSILQAPKRTDGLPPIAPAWRDIAVKYRDDPGAADRLTRVVMTGSKPSSRHWVGKVSAVAMPPNAVVVTEAEARVLVNWILVLVP